MCTHSSTDNLFVQRQTLSMVCYGKVSISLPVQASWAKQVCPHKSSWFCFSLPATRWKSGQLCPLCSYMKPGQVNAVMSRPVTQLFTLLSARAKSLKSRFKSRDLSPLKLSNHLICLNHSKYTEANWLQAMTNFCFQPPLFLSVLKYLLFPTVITCFFRNESLPLNLSQKTTVIMHILSTFRCSEPQRSRDRAIIK